MIKKLIKIKCRRGVGLELYRLWEEALSSSRWCVNRKHFVIAFLSHSYNQFWAFENFQNQNNCGVWVVEKKIRSKEPFTMFLKLQRTIGFHERTNKDLAVLGRYISQKEK